MSALRGSIADAFNVSKRLHGVEELLSLKMMKPKEKSDTTCPDDENVLFNSNGTVGF